MAPSRRAVRVPQLAATLAVVAWCAAPAAASHLITRDATDVRLQVSRDGKALVSYRARGVARHVLASGAINARPSELRQPPGRVPGRLLGRLRHSRTPAVPARPPLAWLVTACRAPDGSYWAVQSWPRTLPNYGALRPPGTRLLGAAALALVWAASTPRHPLRLGVQPLPADLRPSDVPRASRLRLPLDTGGRASGRLRAQHLRRHARLRLRQGLAPGELVSHAPADGRLLLRLLSPRQLSARAMASATAPPSWVPE